MGIREGAFALSHHSVAENLARVPLELMFLPSSSEIFYGASTHCLCGFAALRLDTLRNVMSGPQKG